MYFYFKGIYYEINMYSFILYLVFFIQRVTAKLFLENLNLMLEQSRTNYRFCITWTTII